MQTPDWHDDSFPELRPHPPWVMQEMIESQPPLLERIATESDTAPLALLLRVPGPMGRPRGTGRTGAGGQPQRRAEENGQDNYQSQALPAFHDRSLSAG